MPATRFPDPAPLDLASAYLLMQVHIMLRWPDIPDAWTLSVPEEPCDAHDHP